MGWWEAADEIAKAITAGQVDLDLPLRGFSDKERIIVDTEGYDHQFTYHECTCIEEFINHYCASRRWHEGVDRWASFSREEGGFHQISLPGPRYEPSYSYMGSDGLYNYVEPRWVCETETNVVKLDFWLKDVR